MKTAKRRKGETPEQKVDRWIAGQSKISSARRAEIREAWEPGQVGYVTVCEVNYERYDLDEGGYVVIIWDDGGNVQVG